MKPRPILAATLAALVIGPAVPAAAQDDAGRLRSLRDRLASLEARARSGAVGVLPGPSGPGAPRWLVVDPADVRNQLAALVLAGEMTEAEMAVRASRIERGFDDGLARLRRALADVEARTGPGDAPAARPAPDRPPARVERPDPTPAPDRTPPSAAGRSEAWTFHLTGVGGTGEGKALASLSGRLDLTIDAGGGASGTVSWEGGSVADPSVDGSVRDRRVLLRFDVPGGAGEAVLTGIVDATGKHVNGRYRVTSGSSVVQRGSWRASRP